jgi:4a-hydroxytetrahydrobiopterin dehydratase
MNESNATTQLTPKECKPCSGETPRLQGAELKKFSDQLGEGWRLVVEHHLEKDFSFKNFREALDFTNRVGDIAEKENHHPDIFLTWGKVGLKIWTHKIGGLSENDFILAAKADKAFQGNGAAH